MSIFNQLDDALAVFAKRSIEPKMIVLSSLQFATLCQECAFYGVDEQPGKRKYRSLPIEIAPRWEHEPMVMNGAAMQDYFDRRATFTGLRVRSGER